MAKLKYLKLPKKPKASASVATLRAYVDKVAAIKRTNQERAKINAEHDRLKKQVHSINGTHVMPGTRSSAIHHKPRRKKSTTKKAVRKSARRKR